MSKFTYRLILMLAALTMLLAACGPAGAEPGAANGTGGVVASPDVPETGPGVVDPAAGPCVGVDTTQLTAAGQQLYDTSCASCHGAQGEGVGNFPAIAGNTVVTGADVTQLVQDYFAVEAHPRDLTPDQLASLLTYTRGAFGNTGEVVCPADIQIPVTQ